MGLMSNLGKLITSTKNPHITHCLKLRLKKRYRDKYQRLVLIGKDIIQELHHCKVDLKTRSLYVTDKEDISFGSKLTPEVFHVADHVMEKLTGMQSNETIKVTATMVAEVDYPTWDEDWTSSRVLALNGIQDPGNLGTLLRTCLSFHWKPVLLLPNCCDPYNEKVLKAAAGAAFSVPHFRIVLNQLPSLLQNKELYPVAAASPSTKQNMHKFEDVVKKIKATDKNLCLFLGSEGQGLTPQVEALCEETLVIPTSNTMESLNVAVAGGILMHLLQSTDTHSSSTRSEL